MIREGLGGLCFSRVGDFGFAVTARCRGVHGGGDGVKVWPNKTPCGISKHNDSDVSVLQILLIAKVLVGRQSSNPESSARVSNSPFETRSHPASFAFVIT
jgi:hypothetical protein